MPRRLRIIPGPSRLSGILAQLTKQPRLELNHELTSLRVSYKNKNGDFGARYFVKEELPRIRYANPTLPITVDKLPPNASTTQDPTMVLEFANGPPRTLSLTSKWSTAILTDLMSTAGSPLWDSWVQERSASGASILEEAQKRRSKVWKEPMRPKNVGKNQGVRPGAKLIERTEAGGEKDAGDVKELLGLDASESSATVGTVSSLP